MAIGPYGARVAACQPASAVQVTVTMWSVKTVPKPGFASTRARSSSERGEVDRSTVNGSVVSGATVMEER